ncbi:MAG: helix-turn-helix domain-containing protein [Hyphomicrobiales bacterium]|nr:helix-turn-helix domain-containing protein [Hyphomicrobiales bacterium]MCP5374094.1 helix-turn-helix domain-containing protein [Hyphomicrobiales bacterium]
MARDPKQKGAGAGTDAGKGSGRAERSGQVQSLARALSILNTLAENGAGMTLTGIVSALGLAPSTVHRLLTTLQNERYVRFDRDSGLWQVGVQAFVIGNGFLQSRDLVSIARPYMRKLMGKSGETANLAVVEGGEVIYLAQVESQEMMRALAKPGARVPLHCSAVGKVLLAELGETEVTRVIKNRGLPRLTEKTIVDAAHLRRELDRVREQGYALDDEEHAIGLRCAAAPVFDEYNEPLAAVSLSGPMVRITDRRLPELGALVREAAAEITAALGGRGPNRLAS